MFLGGLLYPFVDGIVEKRRASRGKLPFELIEREIADLSSDKENNLEGK